MIKFQYYPAHVKSNKPKGFVSLQQFIRATKQPKNNIIDIFERIKEAEDKNDKKTKSKLKQENLFYFTPCVNVDGYRRYDNIIKWTGLAVLDFDHIDNAEDFKEYFFYEFRWIIATWISPSKRGVKAIVNIPICTSVEEFKDRFNALEDAAGMFNGFDSSGKNCVLPLFQSYDPDILYRDDFSTFTGIKQKFNEFDYGCNYNFKADSKQEARIIKIIDSGLSKITTNGHPQLRALCVAVGGYVSAGYIGETTALDYINSRIQTHSYLRKGVKGYQKTAKEMIRYGSKKPLEI